MKISRIAALEIVEGSAREGLVLVISMPSDDTGKYQYHRHIFLHIETRTFFMFEVELTGSWFTEYNREYNEDADDRVTLREVLPRPTMCIEWVAATTAIAAND